MTDLEYRSLGRSGLRVSVVGLGGNNFGRTGTATETQEGTNAVIEAALDAGVDFIDTADVYGREYGLSEALLGEALRGRRDEVVIATKFGHASIPSPLPAWGARGSRRYIRLAVEGSLRRLQTDWIDLYQLHTPDPETPRTFGWLYTLAAWGGVVFCVVLTVWLFWTLFVHTASGTSRGLSVENSKATQTAVAMLYATPSGGSGGLPMPTTGVRAEFPATCAACHKIEGTSAAGAVCPDLSHIGTVALERIADPGYTGTATTAEAYILESLMNVNAYIVPPEGNNGQATSVQGPNGAQSLMPQAIADQLTDAQKQALAAYLATLE